MFALKSLDENDPLLLTSPIVRGMLKTAQFIQDNNGIGLTKSGYMNRKFVHWAAAEFDWPKYSEEELFSINKVLNEWDFPPVSDIHELMIGLKLCRRYKGKLLLTKLGKDVLSNPARTFETVVPAFVFNMDHGAHLRNEGGLMGNWDIFLNVINVEAHTGASQSDIRTAFYGEFDRSEHRFDRKRCICPPHYPLNLLALRMVFMRSANNRRSAWQNTRFGGSQFVSQLLERTSGLTN